MADTLSPEEIEWLIAEIKARRESASRSGYYGLSDNGLDRRAEAALRELADCKRVLAEAQSALTMRANDVKAVAEIAHDLFMFVEDIKLVGRIRFTPEWEERYVKVTRHASRLAAAKEKPNG